MNKCPVCNHELTKIKNGVLQSKHKTSNGSKDILVENLSYAKCDYCNEIFFDPEESENYELQLEKAFEKERKCENLLTAKEIKMIRKKYDLTQAQLELLLKIGPKNVAKWETYKSNQSSTIDNLLRRMDEDYCFFLKMLSNVEVKDFQNVITKHSFYLEKISIIELILKLYPDVNVKNLSKEFVEYIDKMIKELVLAMVKEKNSQLILSEAV